MTTVTIQDTSPQAKRLVPFAKVKRKKVEVEPEFNLYESLDRAFAEVRLMLDGKQPKKTAQEFLEELRREKQNGK